MIAVGLALRVAGPARIRRLSGGHARAGRAPSRRSLVLGLVALSRRGCSASGWRLGPVGAPRPRPRSRVETAVPLGERRSLVIVAVEGRRLLLGLTPAQVSLVTELRGDGSGFRRRARPGVGRPAGSRLMKRARRLVFLVVVSCVGAGLTGAAAAAGPATLDLTLDGVGRVSAPLQIVLLLTLLSFLPAILVTMTSFTRIAIVFHFLRQALGTQEMPSNQILMGLTLFLTMFIMAPVGERINDAARAAGARRADRRDRGADRGPRRRCASSC